VVATPIRQPSRRRWVLIALGVIVLLGIILSSLTGFYVDLLWFREVRFSSVFWSVFWSKVVLGVIFGVLFFILLGINLFIVRRITPRYRPFSPEQEVIERYRSAFEPYARYIIPGVVALISLFVGLGAAGQWQTFLLWKSAGNVSFHAIDPVFRRDPSFYIFILPFQKFVQGWLFSALVGTSVIVGVAHYLSGGIRLQTVGEKVTPQVKAHLSVLFGLIVLVKAWGYYLGKFDLLVSPRGVVTGASYTDIHAQLPALKLLVFIAIACSVLFLVNIRFRGWALPVLGIGLLALTSIVAGAAVPAAVQKLSVDPQELQRELVYIQRNITATRQAFGLDRSNLALTQTGVVAEDVTADEIEANRATTDNIRLWSPEILRQTYDNLQRIQPYYEFPDVDVDRYGIQNADGIPESRLVMISPREISQDGIPGGGGTWQNRHLFYTHGYGAVASPVNTVTPEGLPNFVLKDIPPPPDAAISFRDPEGPQIYYGERADVPYVVVGTKMKELNYPSTAGQQVNTTTYQGAGGIQMGGFFRRLVFAYKYKDINLLISGLITSDSRILINRDIETRISKAAPFLKYDADPYAAIVDGRLVYIWDAYTSTDLYPYSERVNLRDAATGLRLVGQSNYIRNSVKVVVDAYEGTVKFYIMDKTDPLIQVWRNAFPSLFQAGEPPPDLLAHFRYPENLLQVQASMFANYHVTDAQTFYAKEKFWALPSDPNPTARGATLRPYYVLLKLPGTFDEQFVLFEPFTPFDRPNMVAYMVGQSDAGHFSPDRFGKLVAFEFPTGENVDGPTQVFSRISQDPTWSQQQTLLSQGNSRVAFGNLLVIPIEDSFLYVQPAFVVSSQNAIPELKRVIVVHGGQVTVGNSLDEALAASVGQPTPGPGPEPGPQPTGRVARLLAQADQHFKAAEAALRDGDLATYQAEIKEAERLVQQALEEAQKQPSPSPSPSPTG
jgi:uncharacterized protein